MLLPRHHQRLSTVFHPQTDGQTEKQISTMKAYFWVFINFKQDDWVRLLPMAEFTCNNTKNAITSYMLFELNCGYHPWVLYKEDFDPLLQLKITKELSSKLRELMILACKTFTMHKSFKNGATIRESSPKAMYRVRRFGWVANTSKPSGIASWKPSFWVFFWVLHLVGKQAYKLKLPKKWKIYDVFYVLLLEQDTTKKGQVNDMQLKFEAGNNKKYKFDGIWNSAIYAKKLTTGLL